ncbi:MAG TPA: signal peptidase II, partial [Kiloniellaceae bacterium]|nr:signal peptidase II [Kiloniellaceae bacterium]
MQRTLGLAAVILVFDQITKAAILATMPGPGSVIEVTGFFNLVLTYNTGVSFGLLQNDSPWGPYLLSGLALAVVAALLVWVKRQPVGLLPYGIGLVVGGAIGNVIDRMHQPGVVDFLDFHL